MLIGGPVALAVRRFTPEVLTEVETEFLASVGQHRVADGRYLIPGEFVTAVGWRLDAPLLPTTNMGAAARQ